MASYMDAAQKYLRSRRLLWNSRFWQSILAWLWWDWYIGALGENPKPCTKRYTYALKPWQYINLGGQRIPTISSEFHIYTLDWTAEKLVFSVDGKPHYTYSPAIKNQANWPFDNPQYVLLNFAIEKVVDSEFTEATFDIDYVRIYDTTGVAVFIDEFN